MMILIRSWIDFCSFVLVAVLLGGLKFVVFSVDRLYCMFWL